MYKVIEKNALLENGEFTNNLWVPQKKRAQYSITIKNSNKTYTKELTQVISNYQSCGWRCSNITYDTIPVDTMTFSGHSTSSWENAVEWNAFDEKKNLLAVYNVVPYTLAQELDTFCVKLWAGTSSAVSDTTFLSNRGARYGIVDEQYSLLALEQDVVSNDEKKLLENGGLPFLTDEEIFLSNPLDETNQSSVITSQSECVFSKFSFFKLGNGAFRLTVPGGEIVKSIRIFDLSGRLVFQFRSNMSNLANNFTFQNDGKLSRGVYSIIVETTIQRHTTIFQIL
jgi:hypothetical protein